mmetsp:Transcript_12565/g.23483  ORF Transcript_12565/g.23483 Transcript_12565/m.23483 type:complete len:215 (-) Transcript_12565:1203-1847(-)
MFFRLFSSLSVVALLFSPASAQFGVGGNRKKKGSSFQELNEMAKQQGGGGVGEMDQLMKQMGMDPAEIQKMMGEVDPSMLQELADLGPKFDEMMKLMADMSPEELQKQMQDAMDMLTGGDIMANMFQNQEYILKALEESGTIDPQELEKYKKDPEYFEQKMKEGLDQMKELFSNPEVLQAATETMKATTEMFQNPVKIGEMMESMMGDLDDEKN